MEQKRYESAVNIVGHIQYVMSFGSLVGNFVGASLSPKGMEMCSDRTRRTFKTRKEEGGKVHGSCVIPGRKWV